MIAGAVGAGYAGLLVLATYAGSGVLALGLVLGQAAFAAGWGRLLRAPGSASGAYLVGAAGLVADGALLLTRHDDPSLAPLAGVLGLVFVTSLVHQLTRPRGRVGLMASMGATVAGAVLTIAAASYLPTLRVPDALPLLVTGLAALAAAAVTASFPLPPRMRAVAAIAGALAVGLAASTQSDVVTVGGGVLVGALAGAGAALARLLVMMCQDGEAVVVEPAADIDEDPSIDFQLAVLSTLPVALTGPLLYIATRLLLG